MTKAESPSDIAAIAASLTEAQRHALAAPNWSMLEQYRAGILEPLRLGLLSPDGLGHSLTPLGLAVRALLAQRSTTNGS